MELLARALNDDARPIKGLKILMLGVAYKPNVNDMRESPALEIIDLLVARGASLRYHDPHVPELPGTALSSVELTDGELTDSDAVVIVTDHEAIDWNRVASVPDLVVDLRNRLQPEKVRGRLWRL